MTPKQALSLIAEGKILTVEESYNLITQMMSGEIEPVLLSAILTALSIRGEDTAELLGAQQAMRDLSITITPPTDKPLIDTCGTGGSGHKLVNCSTAVAFVVSCCGARVAKHGNRTATRSSGSADVLEQAGINIEMIPEVAERALAELDICFLFAQTYHQAMRNVGPARQAIGIKTLFNVVGPLTNPAGVKRQLIGVAQKSRQQQIAAIQLQLKSERSLIVTSSEGLDEISPAGNTLGLLVENGEMSSLQIQASDYIDPTPLDKLAVDSPAASLALIRQALEENKGDAAGMIALNSAAALLVAELVDDIGEGVAMAQQIMLTGQPWQKVEKLAQYK